MNNNILIPRNLESRKEKLRQDRIKLLSQEILEGDLTIDETFDGIPEELIKVKEIKGNIDLRINKSYIPKWLKDVKIHGSFNCSYNNLSSLENCPQYIGDDFYCSHNKLTSLEGCPKYIGEDMGCQFNKLTSLDNCPQYISGSFSCSYNKLTSLKGCPKYIGGNLFCRGNKIKLELQEDIELKGNLFNAHLPSPSLNEK